MCQTMIDVMSQLSCSLVHVSPAFMQITTGITDYTLVVVNKVEYFSY